MVLRLLSEPTESRRKSIATKLGVSTLLLREWEREFLSELTPLLIFPPKQRGAVARARLSHHLMGALNAALEGAPVCGVDERGKMHLAVTVVQALVGALGDSDSAAAARRDLRKVAVACIDRHLGDPLIIPSDYRGSVRTENQWSARKNRLLDIVQDALEAHDISAQRSTGGYLRKNRLAELCSHPETCLKQLDRVASPELVEVAQGVAAHIHVGLLYESTAADGLGEKPSVTVLHAIVADALHRGSASTPQLGLALAYSLGVRDLKNFFDARAVSAWERRRTALSRMRRRQS